MREGESKGGKGRREGEKREGEGRGEEEWGEGGELYTLKYI